MGTDDLQRQIERIQKLLALAMADPDTPEAIAASKKAAELLAKYELDMADLTEENKNDVLMEKLKNYNSHHQKWEATLLTVLRETFDVHPVVVVGDNGRSYEIFGKKQDLVMVVFLFKTVRRFAIKRGEKLYKLVKERTAFQNGIILAVARRLQDIKLERQQHRTEHTTALAVQNKTEVINYVKNLYKKLKMKTIKTKGFSPSNSKEQKAFHKGVEEGKKLSLNTPIEEAV